MNNKAQEYEQTKAMKKDNEVQYDERGEMKEMNE